jgi:hypothetical protein
MTEQFDFPEICKAAQCAVVLSNLQEHTRLTTCDIREGLGVLMPATRIFELRQEGFNIKTIMGLHPDGDGRLRRQAMYVLTQQVTNHD